MKPAEARITALFVRLSYGFHADEFRITQAEIMKRANLKSKSSLINGLKDVLKRGFFAKGNQQSQYLLCTKVGTESVPYKNRSGTESVPKVGTKSVPLNSTLFVHKVGTESVPSTIKVKNKKNKERKKEELPTPSHFENFNAMYAEHKSQNLVDIEQAIIECVSNPTKRAQIAKVAEYVETNEVTAQDITEWFGEGSAYWYEVSHGKKDGSRPYVGNIESDLLRAIRWSKNPTHQNGYTNGYHQNETAKLPEYLQPDEFGGY